MTSFLPAAPAPSRAATAVGAAPQGVAPLLGTAGACLIAYMAFRPWGAEADPATFADPRWPLSHVAAMAGFTLTAAAAVEASASWPRGARLATRAAAWASALLLLPYYGAEAFALSALGARGADEPTFAAVLPDLAQAVRMGPLQVTLFGLGWVALAGLGVLLARGLGRSPGTWRRPALTQGHADDAVRSHGEGHAHPRGLGVRAASWTFAAGLASYLPVFYVPAAGRVAHALVTGGAAITLAVLLGRRRG